MEKSRSQRNAALGILLTCCVYIGFVFLTDWKDYTLVAPPEGYRRWVIIRLATMSVWLLGAALLLRFRKHPVNWQSFLYAFVATCILAIVFSPCLVAKSMNYLAIAGTIGFYGMVSGLMCVTVRKPRIAAVLGLILFLAQFLVDATAHIFSGVFRFQ